MKEFVEYIVKQLVEYPDKVVVTEDEVDGRTVVSVKVEKPDMGKVIGRRGQNADAIRLLLVAYGKRIKRDVRFNIIDEERDGIQS